MKPRRKGKIIPNGVVLETHENATVVYFTELGFDIDLIVPSRTPGQKSADFMMDGIAWEMKCPKGKSINTLEHTFKNALKQSENLIFDLRAANFTNDAAIKILAKRFNESKKCRRMKIITKSEELLELNK